MNGWVDEPVREDGHPLASPSPAVPPPPPPPRPGSDAPPPDAVPQPWAPPVEPPAMPPGAPPAMPPGAPPEQPEVPWTPPPGTPFVPQPIPIGADGFPLFGPGSLAPFGRRAAARIIDTLLLVIPFGVVVLVVWTHTSDAGELVAESVPLWFGLGMRLAAIVYETVAIALTGRTLGKVICRLRVEDAHGGRPGLSAAATRIAVPDLLSLIPLFGWAITVVLYVSARHVPLGRHLYDRLAGTVVVSTR